MIINDMKEKFCEIPESIKTEVLGIILKDVIDGEIFSTIDRNNKVAAWLVNEGFIVKYDKIDELEVMHISGWFTVIGNTVI